MCRRRLFSVNFAEEMIRRHVAVYQDGRRRERSKRGVKQASHAWRVYRWRRVGSRQRKPLEQLRRNKRRRRFRRSTRKRSTAAKTRIDRKARQACGQAEKEACSFEGRAQTFGGDCGFAERNTKPLKGGEADVDQGEGFGQSQQDWGSRESKSFVGEQAQLKASGSEIAIEERPER